MKKMDGPDEMVCPLRTRILVSHHHHFCKRLPKIHSKKQQPITMNPNRRCMEGGCMRQRVSNGKCVAHGGKKPVCGKEGCNKQRKKQGMCKSHFAEYVAEKNNKQPIDVDKGGMSCQISNNDSLLGHEKDPLDGFILHDEINKELVKKMSKNIPKLEKVGGVRRICRNEDKFVGEKILKEVEEAVKELLSKHGVAEKMGIFNDEWILACPVSKCRNVHHGPIHRDCTEGPGYLTCIIFVGETDENYGKIKIWKESQNIHPADLFHTLPANIRRILDKLTTVDIGPDMSTNIVIFDSRLLHQSLIHQGDYQRSAFSFYVNVGERKPLQGDNDVFTAEHVLN